ncbi:carboxymuconolactone decarboxylase family protein [Oceanihabitans sediminis]|uniref:Carboxymuconolactone decarboxylase family protein n=1 Tax=Oceanihabitans sediminis TaxID=1812012 RepID=A0A368P2Q0_9FLAO|nr:carboxymuconolactone decarboxylase family protein [Oceanihabitans sediminis]MDX1279000.1 carboxymuconolactone decarboxylase family protein [Oceanihabitans sediminis]RBP28496.1 putative peroxidase-related enzyme [Oceanihabitans sediminis]RCU56693.1 carboxymuconolactone decarboxylase family protein [Oceanihabitans sediminis]
MKNVTKISVPTKSDVNEKSQVLFNQLQSQLGMVPNLYATIGYSSNALENFLTFSGNAGKVTFSNKEIEAIKLAVSQANNCIYCKSAHTAIAKMNGFSDAEAAELRNATIADPKLKVLTALAKQVAQKAGHVDDEIRESFFELGYDAKALMDFIAVVIAITFTNYAQALTKVDVDFPLVEN